MAYQEVTKTSYGSRLGNSLKGIGSGLLLFVLATALLWWNENNAKKKADVIKEFDKKCVVVEDVSRVDPELNGKPIHATAVAMSTETLIDPDYDIQVENGIWLNRSVEYYQWVEHSKSETKDKIGGGQETVTTYDYSLEWVGSPVNSNAFHDPDYRDLNITRLTVEDKEIGAQKVSFGGYTLPKGLVSSIPADDPVALPADLADGVTSHVDGNVLYYGENPTKPAVGDVRVTFTQGTGGVASVLAKVKDDTFEAFTSKAKNNNKTFWMLQMGNRDKEDMVESAKSANKAMLWLLRILGIILVIAALRMMFSILVTILKVLPPLAKVGELGVNLVTAVVGFIWSLLVILIAWVAVRPFVAIPLAVAIAALIFFLIKKSKAAPEPAPAAAPAAPAAPEAPKPDAE